MKKNRETNQFELGDKVYTYTGLSQEKFYVPDEHRMEVIGVQRVCTGDYVYLLKPMNGDVALTMEEEYLVSMDNTDFVRVCNDYLKIQGHNPPLVLESE